MRKRLFNQQSEPRSCEAQKTWRLSVKAKIMMALFALMLIPQGAWAYDLWIGGQQVNTSGVDYTPNTTGFGSIITYGAIMYIESTNTLKLTDAVIVGDIVWGVDNNLNIELDGVNVMTGRIISQTTGYTLTFIKSSASTGNCSLTINSGAVAATSSVISGFSDVWYKGIYLVSSTPISYDGSQMKMLYYQYPNSPSDASSISLKSDHVYHRIWVNGTQLTDLNLSPMAPNLV